MPSFFSSQGAFEVNGEPSTFTPAWSLSEDATDLPLNVQQMIRLRLEGKRIKEIALMLGVHPQSVGNSLGVPICKKLVKAGEDRLMEETLLNVIRDKNTRDLQAAEAMETIVGIMRDVDNGAHLRGAMARTILDRHPDTSPRSVEVRHTSGGLTDEELEGVMERAQKARDATPTIDVTPPDISPEIEHDR